MTGTEREVPAAWDRFANRHPTSTWTRSRSSRATPRNHRAVTGWRRLGRSGPFLASVPRPSRTRDSRLRCRPGNVPWALHSGSLVDRGEGVLLVVRQGTPGMLFRHRVRGRRAPQRGLVVLAALTVPTLGAPALLGPHASRCGCRGHRLVSATRLDDPPRDWPIPAGA